MTKAQSLPRPKARNPIVAAIVALGVSSVSVAARAQAPETPPDNPVAAEFANQYLPKNLPSPELTGYYPQNWPTYAANTGRNASFPLPASAPKALHDGVSWSFAGAGAMPLDGPPMAGSFKTTAYTAGMPVGVSVVGGIVYVGDDNGYTYALNAVTGQMIWAFYGWNMTMSNPLVSGGKVIVSTGNPYFNFANTMKYLRGERPVRGPGLNTIFALDRTSGKQIWAFHTPGQAMPTPLLDGKFVYAGTGDGHIYKLAADTGALVWQSDIVSFVSMSSPVGGDGRLFVGGTKPNLFYAIDEETGNVAWKAAIPDVIPTGVGDCTPAYADGAVIDEVTVRSGSKDRPVANILVAFDAKDGHVLWQDRFPDGPIPPAMKTATPVIVDGVVYEGSPVSGDYFGVDLKTGRQLWSLHLGSQMRAGAAIADGVAYLPYRSGDIAAIRVRDGVVLGVKHVGGGFGPSSPVIFGGTLYVSNIYGWVNAVPLSNIKNGRKAAAL